MEPILPMLAVAGEPFDSSEHVFEVKWDGIRALAICGSHARMWGRDGNDYTHRYPELRVLKRLPDETMVVGELVRFMPDGRPDFTGVLSRHQSSLAQAAGLATHRPVTFVVFDLLYERGRSLIKDPLHERRDRLQTLIQHDPDPRWQFSDGVVGSGKTFFEAAVRQGQEGVMAKHLKSPYRPGRRFAAWRKIKPQVVVPCVIVGFVPGRNSIYRLLVAIDEPGGRRFIARIRPPGDGPSLACLQRLLEDQASRPPPMACADRAVWLEPGLQGRVRGLGWDPRGQLRSPYWLGLHEAPNAAPSGAIDQPLGGR